MTGPDLPASRARAAGRAKFEWVALPTVLAIVCVLLYLPAMTDARWHDALDYRRSQIASGQAWRLVTAHLMHLNAAHLTLDVAGLWLVAWIFARELGWKRQALALLAGVVFVDFGLWWFHPEIARYVGLSGALHALFAAGATGWMLACPATPANRDARAAPMSLLRTWGAALLIGLGAKLVLENAGDAFWLHATRFDVVTAAHRWGSVGGVAVGVVYATLDRITCRRARLRT